MRSNVLNFLFFLVIATGFWFLWTYADKNWFPRPEKKPKPDESAVLEEARKKADEAYQEMMARKTALGAMAGGVATNIEPVKPTPKAPEKKEAAAAKPTPCTLVALGDPSYNLHVLLNTRGGGVQQVVLTKFDAADRLGREVREKDPEGKPTKKGVPLYLIPGLHQFRTKYLREEFVPPVLLPGKVLDAHSLAETSYTILHYPGPDDKYPDPFLGETNWKIVSEEHPAGGEHKVVFETELAEPYFVKFRKTFTLAPGDYHIGFKLDIERLPGGQKGKGLLRYQIAGPHGLPIEGEWYTSTYRVAEVGWTDRKGTPRRQYEDAATIAAKRGGEAVSKADNTFKYMVVATQYFASGVAVDDTAEGAAKNPWAYVRATTELPFNQPPNPNLPYFDDVTVRAASDTIDLAPGDTAVTHKYLIYNGPVKVRLLGLMKGDRAVNPALVERYLDRCDLRTITDFHSPTWIGAFANAIYWSDLVTAFTNLMHWLMATIHGVVGSWAMAIIILTVMVRLLLFYPSRKQTQMNMKMMEVQKRLAPQLEELQKRYKDDPNTYNREKMRLMMANGANPLAAMGGCLLLFLQMPVMMGLYFCLQESVFFRLEPFLWIDNLAAPDMLLWWTEKIPYVSTPEDLGSFIYLGPYLNILPLVAVGLMIWQQNKMMPPPTDEQMAQQQRMMKIMMGVMALMFYKVAAGLALYFIIGTTWGLLERRFIPKPDDKPADPNNVGTNRSGPGNSPAATDKDEDKPRGMFGRLKEAMQKRMEELQKQAEEQSRRQIRNTQDSGNKKKKKRK